MIIFDYVAYIHNTFIYNKFTYFTRKFSPTRKSTLTTCGAQVSRYSTTIIFDFVTDSDIRNAGPLTPPGLCSLK